MNRSTILLVALGVFSACGGGGGGSSVPIDQAAPKLTHAICTKIFECCDQTERDQLFQLFNPKPTTAAECESTAGALFAADFNQDVAAVQAGRADYDASQAGACIDAWGSLTCTGGIFDANPSECDNVFTGKVAAGGMCAKDEECAGTAFCKGASNDQVNGTCAALPGTGESCPDDRCQKGNFCKDGMCAALEANGTACTDAAECSSRNCDATSHQCADPAPTCDGM